jgi:hypothetical protein
MALVSSPSYAKLKSVYYTLYKGMLKKLNFIYLMKSAAHLYGFILNGK